MSEAAAERPTRPQPPGSSGAPGNVFTRKFGPLPGWGWAALAGVAAIGYIWYRNRSGNAAAQAAAAQTDTTATGDDVQGQLATLQTEIQDLQGTESTEAETGPIIKGPGDGPIPGKRKTRHVSTGKENFNQVAKAAGTSVAHIVSVSRSSGENQANLSKLLEWAAHPHTRRKGVVYYTD